jgi:hypothetical protein
MFFLSLLLRWLFLRALLLLISRSPFQPAQKVKPSSLELRRLSRRRAFWRNPSPSWMRVLVLRQEKSILVVFDRRPQLIGLSVRADVLNSAKKRMDSFPGLFISQTEETEQKRERVDVSRDAMKTRRRSSSSSSSFRNNTTTRAEREGKILNFEKEKEKERSETTTHHIYIYSERERERSARGYSLRTSAR